MNIGDVYVCVSYICLLSMAKNLDAVFCKSIEHHRLRRSPRRTCTLRQVWILRKRRIGLIHLYAILFPEAECCLSESTASPLSPAEVKGASLGNQTWKYGSSLWLQWSRWGKGDHSQDAMSMGISTQYHTVPRMMRWFRAPLMLSIWVLLGAVASGSWIRRWEEPHREMLLDLAELSPVATTLWGQPLLWPEAHRPGALPHILPTSQVGSRNSVVASESGILEFQIEKPTQTKFSKKRVKGEGKNAKTWNSFKTNLRQKGNFIIRKVMANII